MDQWITFWSENIIQHLFHPFYWIGWCFDSMDFGSIQKRFESNPENDYWSKLFTEKTNPEENWCGHHLSFGKFQWQFGGCHWHRIRIDFWRVTKQSICDPWTGWKSGWVVRSDKNPVRSAFWTSQSSKMFAFWPEHFPILWIGSRSPDLFFATSLCANSGTNLCRRADRPLLCFERTFK